MTNWFRPWRPASRHGLPKDGIILPRERVSEILMKALEGRMDNLAYQYRLADKMYYLPTLEAIKDIITANRIDKRKWMSEKFDCDDFAFNLKVAFIEEAWRKQKRRYPTAMGILWGFKLKEGHHALNCVITDQEKFLLIEPQDDRIFSLRKEDRRIYLVLM